MRYNPRPGRYPILCSFALAGLLALLSGCGAPSPTGATADKKNDSVATDSTGTGAVNGKGGDKANDPKYNSPAMFTIQLGKVGALSKTSSILMRKLILTAFSNAVPSDTVRDSSSLDGTGNVTIKRLLKLKPKVTWAIQAKALDQRDSIVHQGTSLPFTVKPADTAEVSLSLTSRFVMYQAWFSNLPYYVSAEGGGTDRIPINLNRVSLKIDGVVKADSSARDWFLPGQDVSLGCDYVTASAHSVTLEAYGQVGSFQGLLFSGTGSISSNPGEDGSKPITLVWVGPNSGASRVTVIIGRVGKVTVMGGFTPVLQ